MKKSASNLVKFWLVSLSVACVALQFAGAHAQQQGGTPQADKVAPVNSGANPYRVIRDKDWRARC